MSRTVSADEIQRGKYSTTASTDNPKTIERLGAFVPASLLEEEKDISSDFIWPERHLDQFELGITNSVAYALGKYGIQVPDKREFSSGPPLQESFERFYGFSKEECLRPLTTIMVFFSERLYENGSI